MATTSSSSRRPGRARPSPSAIPLVECIEPGRPPPGGADPRADPRARVADRRTSCDGIAAARALSVAPVYGGVGLEKQAKQAARAHILVATPGRLEDLLERRAFSPRRAADPRHRRGRPDARHGLQARRRPDRRARRPTTARRCSSRRRSRPLPARSPAPTPTRPSATSTSRSSEDQGEISHRFVHLDHDRQARRAHRRAARLASAAARWSSCAPSTAPTGWSSGSSSSNVNAVAMHGNKTQNQRNRALAQFTVRQGRHARRHRRRRPRHRRRRHHARDQLRRAR